MSDIFYANQVELGATRSQQEEDPGDVLLIFQCAVPVPGGPPETIGTLGQLVIGMTYANACVLSEVLQQNLTAPRDPRYRGPVIRRERA